jgi:hypothetical protein
MRLQAAGLVASSQFVNEMLEMGRHTCRLRTKRLLETLAHGVADCSARPVIERFAVVLCVRALHDYFRTPDRVFNQVTPYQVPGTRFVSSLPVCSGPFWQIFYEEHVTLE